MAVKVHLRSEIGRFGQIVRVGGPLRMASRHTLAAIPTRLDMQGGAFVNANTAAMYRGTSLIKTSADLGPYSRAMPRAL